ncbi:hypothetical protein [Candidatus Uabimicrobium amorphum]|uniref:hypothetical protein n=1 Tax=Uabimicrobium amorphum TaxID=2596890 RepID=UPI00125FD5DC|nr:hypothetical protein [Candidatus Uabimicrobium amorphum]
MSDIISLLFTITAEFLIVCILVKNITLKRLLLYCVLVNCLTQPLANYLYTEFIIHNWEQVSAFLLLEFSVIVVEMFLWRLLLQRSHLFALYLSVVANFATATVGLFFH